MKKSKSKVIQKRDYKIFKKIWKWKIFTTQAIATMFKFETPFAAYVHMNRLKDAGLVQKVQISEGKEYGWGLTNKSFKFIREDMTKLTQDGFKSEHSYHDHLVTAFHLGDWLVEHPTDCETCSEQQLRRIPIELWSHWVPRMNSHRPDGYSKFTLNNQQYIAAFEVELNHKTIKHYEELGARYDAEEAIDLVFWLVPTDRFAEKIINAFKKMNPRNIEKHNFVYLPEFTISGWGAKIQQGKYKGKTMTNLLYSNQVTTPLQPCFVSNALKCLDTRNRPIQSESYPNPKKRKNSN